MNKGNARCVIRTTTITAIAVTIQAVISTKLSLLFMLTSLSLLLISFLDEVRAYSIRVIAGDAVLSATGPLLGTSGLIICTSIAFAIGVKLRTRSAVIAHSSSPPSSIQNGHRPKSGRRMQVRQNDGISITSSFIIFSKENIPK